MEKEKIIIASDHAGFNLKNALVQYIANLGFEIIDIGTHSNESCDYPLIAKNVSLKILDGNYTKGILVCGTGIGMAIMANRYKGIRAAVVSDTCSAKMSRSHNNSNVLCLGERIVGYELAKDIVNIWLNTDFTGDRHKKRVDMLDK